MRFWIIYILVQISVFGNNFRSFWLLFFFFSQPWWPTFLLNKPPEKGFYGPVRCKHNKWVIVTAKTGENPPILLRETLGKQTFSGFGKLAGNLGCVYNDSTCNPWTASENRKYIIVCLLDNCIILKKEHLCNSKNQVCFWYFMSGTLELSISLATSNTALQLWIFAPR